MPHILTVISPSSSLYKAHSSWINLRALCLYDIPQYNTCPAAAISRQRAAVQPDPCSSCLLHLQTTNSIVMAVSVVQMPTKRSLVLDKGQVNVKDLLEVQVKYPQWQLHVEIQPPARPGMPQVPPPLLHCWMAFLWLMVLIISPLRAVVTTHVERPLGLSQMPYSCEEHSLFGMSVSLCPVASVAYGYSWLHQLLCSSCTQHRFLCQANYTSGSFCVTDCCTH